MDFPIPTLGGGLSEGSATLLKDFTVAMVIAAVGLALARLVRQPPVLGYLMAGMIIGPFTLPTPLISNRETIELLAELGLILLLFGIGLELGWRRIRSIGFQVLVIGVVEISVLTLFGVWIASILPGIDASHGLYLGGAIAISSSAILLKGLRDGGNLDAGWGRTIVGILLVEDFAAVILLTILAGLATTGTASLAEVGLLVVKLGAFCIVVLVIGTMLASRVMHLLSRFQSDETLLLASLGFCFFLALCATLLGLSPAAGAFLIGVVIGDTEAAGRVTRMVAPVRDMFGALFFLSIGMLIDYHTLNDYILPALVVVMVFMFGKIAANTVGSILAGRSPSDALRVGMTMPQMGEFSLAIGRLTPADVVRGSTLGPILTLCTAITSVLAPLSSRAAVPLSAWADRRTPAPLRRTMLSITLGVDIFWSALSLAGETGERFRNVGRSILINVSIIGVLAGRRDWRALCCSGDAGQTAPVDPRGDRTGNGRGGDRPERSLRDPHLAVTGHSRSSRYQYSHRLVCRFREARALAHGAVHDRVRTCDGVAVAVVPVEPAVCRSTVHPGQLVNSAFAPLVDCAGVDGGDIQLPDPPDPGTGLQRHVHTRSGGHRRRSSGNRTCRHGAAAGQPPDVFDDWTHAVAPVG